MTVDIQFRKPGLSDADLSLLQQRIGAPLPSGYRQFLATGNVGIPAPNVARNAVVTCSVEKFFGVSDVPGDDLGAAIDTYFDRLPAGIVPIALAAGGNLIGLFLRDGSVHFWDHENEASGGEAVGFQNMRLIARSFTEFMALLMPLSPADASGVGAQVISVKVKPGFAERFKGSL